MLDSGKNLVFTIFLSFGLIAEPLLHDHHEIEEQTVIECLACEESELNALTSKFEKNELPIDLKSKSSIQSNFKKTHRSSHSRAPPQKD